ncbi:universal stress protein [Desulforhabdus amnigena]|jgi:universal stress protein A|uniref:Universal stress protein n=1 Tax=Desulforhabdus amnigena TaxID=40218 RepID=A0A9W6CUB8_9BACT|nr:universal stress protein [Desulforhabdus amnigena]NLJ26574.1 universal stress protein [Deltaproteobacteria bacterium]GLI32609.1 universal stress protein [Desulforhabdus amnigena]
MISVQKILVLVDFSKDSEKAVHYGLGIGRSQNARVYFLHMVNQRIIDAVQQLSGKGYKGDFLKALKKLMLDRENDLKEFVPEELREGMDVEFLIRKGEPAEEVINVAKELSIDMIVVGSQGNTALADASIGGVAQSVVNSAPCPVLVVRAVEHDFIS